MRVWLFSILFSTSLIGFSQSNNWVDSTFNSMELTEKISQLFMIPVSAYATPHQIESWQEFIEQYNPGSIYITKGGPKSHIQLVNKLQKSSKVPLLVGLNAEWGLSQTLDSAMQFPYPVIQGANSNNNLIEKLGYEIGLQMRSIGAHINFAPNADINIPFQSTVTNRYLGSDKNNVAQKSIALSNGLKKANVLTVAKHIPGILPDGYHTDSKASFLTVGPDTISFYPYQQLINNNVGGLLTTHLHFSTPEKNKLIPAPVSQIFISDIIKSHVEFDGLLFTEISYLKTITRNKNGKPEEIAFKVGNDILIAPDNIRSAIRRISHLVNKDKAMMKQLEASVKKILKAKFDLGLSVEKQVEPVNLTDKLFAPTATLINQQLKEGATTVIRNVGERLPIQHLEDKKFNLVKIDGEYSDLEVSLNRYVPFNSFSIKSINDLAVAEKSLNNSHFVLIALQNADADLHKWVNKISNEYPSAVIHFGNLQELKELANVPVLLEGYDSETMGTVVAQAIFGGLPTTGKLPFTVNEFLTAGTTTNISLLDRLSYSVPEEVEMDSHVLSKVDSITKEALDIGATPGARVMVARHGKVIFNKSYGWQGVDKKIPVSESTIYDMASVTKVTATLQAVMFLYERGIIDINKKLCEYLPEFKDSNKKDIIIKDILTHQAGLWPYFPWHVDIMKDTALEKQYFNKQQSDEYPFPVSENLFSHKSMRDSMWSWIVKSKLIKKENRTPFEYRYSDLGLYIMQRLVQTITNQPLEDFVSQNFYEPIGATTTGFHPLNRFSPNRIAPTELDKDFRKSLLVGYVHDPGSAMFGGVAGHAGLFSNANDMMKMGQMWLQKGKYGGYQYFKPSTIDRFTMRQFETSRRGLGWDKPTGDWSGSTGIYCSPATFGHTGFTGTCIWVDPEFDLVFVFLSNRVNPEISGKLLSANIRTRIQDVIYQSIFRYAETHGCSETK